MLSEAALLVLAEGGALLFLGSLQGVPLWNWLLQIVGAGTSYLGAELNARLDIRGFYLWITANLVLLVLHVATELWVLCMLDILYCWVCLRGILRWRAARGPGVATQGQM